MSNSSGTNSSSSSKPSGMEGAVVFYFHPSRAWELGVVLGVGSSSVSRGGTSAETTLVRIRDFKNKDEHHDLRASQIFNPTSGVEQLCPDNLLSLPELHHSILLNALRMRHAKDEVYSHMGELIVAVNPFKFTIPHYQPECMEHYLSELDHPTVPPHLKPHTWCVAHRAYVSTIQKRRNHSIIVSGESGSGKTEACKMVLNYICKASEKSATEERKALTEQINKKVQQSNPLLEAFGNAKTLRNDNSSRFGKLMEIQLDEKGSLIGMKITPYLLERSRIIWAAHDERLFHIFYQLVAGASSDIKSELRIKNVRDFSMLTANGAAVVVRGVDDAADFAGTVQAMEDLGIKEEEQMCIWRVLAAILHLQNVKFTERFGKAEVDEAHKLTVAFICTELLRLECEPMDFEKCITKHKKQVGKEIIWADLSKQKAHDQRDSLCKYLYQQLFNWIIDKINLASSAQALSGAHGVNVPRCANYIALLDIFGFEDFVSNSFEQFCINLANEALQRHYSKYMFEKDVEEVQQEDIACKSVKFVDNQPCLDLIMADSGSIISNLDDSSMLDFERNKSTNHPDAVFLDALTNKHKPDYQTVGQKGTKSVLDRVHTEMKSPSDFFDRGRLDDGAFVIKHYAGNVKYQVKGFVEKNIDTLKDFIKEVLNRGRDDCLNEILAIPDFGSEGDFMSPIGSPAGSPRGGGNKSTVASKFRRSLRDLMALLDQTQPNWIRCVRPHPKKQPGLFDGKTVLEQLIASGVLETIEQRQRNFPYRIAQKDFLARYAVISMAATRRMLRASLKDRCTTIANVIGVEPAHAQVGKTKVFLQGAAYNKIETLRREKMERHVLNLGMFLCMRESRHLVSYLKLQRTAIRMQRIFRLTRCMRQIIANYYDQLCKQIEERLASERKQVNQEEAGSRQGIIQVESHARGDFVRVFLQQLGPMVAAVMVNTEKLETIRRRSIEDEEERVFEPFQKALEESEAYHQKLYDARKQREYEEAMREQQLMIERYHSQRMLILQEEVSKREALQNKLRPEQDRIHEKAHRIQRAQEQRDHKITVLMKERDRELRRLQRASEEAKQGEVKLWFDYVGEAGIKEDLDHFAGTAMSPDQSYEQMQRFCHSRAPTSIVTGQSPIGSVRSYKDFSEKWYNKYQRDKEEAVVAAQRLEEQQSGSSAKKSRYQSATVDGDFEDLKQRFPFREAPSPHKLHQAVEHAVMSSPTTAMSAAAELLDFDHRQHRDPANSSYSNSGQRPAAVPGSLFQQVLDNGTHGHQYSTSSHHSSTAVGGYRTPKKSAVSSHSAPRTPFPPVPTSPSAPLPSHLAQGQQPVFAQILQRAEEERWSEKKTRTGTTHSSLARTTTTPTGANVSSTPISPSSFKSSHGAAEEMDEQPRSWKAGALNTRGYPYS